MSFEHRTNEEALAFCRTKAAELGLNIRVTGAEYSSDGAALTFTFTSSGRADLRELMKSLAEAAGCRIELRQVKAG